MQEILNRGPRLAALLLGIAMLGATGWQIYRFWAQAQATAPAPAVTVNVEPQMEQPAVSLSDINLFGTADASQAPDEADTENLPETNLRLVLRGVSASSLEQGENRIASALVEGPDRQTEYYLIGSELPGSASLKAVYPDRIVIERQGNLENLYFPEEFETASFEAQDAQQTVSSRDSTINPVQDPGAQAATGASDARKEEIRARLERLRERLRSNN